jgi:hypothetical protein
VGYPERVRDFCLTHVTPPLEGQGEVEVPININYASLKVPFRGFRGKIYSL